MHGIRFWAAELLTVSAFSLWATAFYPDEASTTAQAGITAGFLISGAVLLVLVVFLANWVAWSPRHQRNDAWNQVDVLAERRQWKRIVDELARHVIQGNEAMESNGRIKASYSLSKEQGGPGKDNVQEMRKFMNQWISDVRGTLQLCPEYLVDFENDNREILIATEKDGSKVPVAVAQLEVRLRHLQDIIREIRAHHLR